MWAISKRRYAERRVSKGAIQQKARSSKPAWTARHGAALGLSLLPRHLRDFFVADSEDVLPHLHLSAKDLVHAG